MRLRLNQGGVEAFIQKSRTFPRRAVFAVLAPVVALAVILPNAWITEDAFISMRVAKNILLGYGPVWNVGERVQVYTHPLWMALLTVMQALFPHNTAQAVIGLSIVTSLTAITLFVAGLKSRWVIVLGMILMLSSKAFIDFSTSGLENPLLFVLVILFAREYLDRRRIFWLTLITALATVTRADAVLLFLPAFIPLAKAQWRQRAFWVDIAKGLIPLIGWEIFSVVYYGYPLPNTYYAKLYTYIPQPVLDQQSHYYYLNSINWDFVTLPVIGLGIIASIWQRSTYRLSLAAGILLYLLAVNHAGGDYMSGRFFAVPFFLALYLLTTWLETLRFAGLKPRKWAIIGLLVALAFITPKSPIFHPITSLPERTGLVDQYKIADEARYYCPETCLYNLANQPSNIYYQEGIAARGQSLVLLKSIGMPGYVVGPKTHIVDELALADPLLSHLSADPTSRIGHFRRDIPDGYLASIQQHANLVTDPCVHRLYDDIRRVTIDHMFTLSRWKSIFELNSGIADHKYSACIQSGGKLN